MPDTPVIITPIVHLNGDRLETLISSLETAYSAVADAIAAVRQTAPNGRNYYPEPGRFQKADAQHVRRLDALYEVMASLEAEAIQLQEEQRS